MKTYATKSNARRAAKTAGIVDFDIIEVDGKFTYQEKQQAPEQPVIGEYVNCPHCGIHLSNGFTTHEAERGDGKKGLVKYAYKCLGCTEEFGPALAARKKKSVKKSADEVRDHSTVVLPTKYVWHVADEMFDAAAGAGQPQPRRKEVIEECVRRGVAYNTARTQYQQWWQCRNGNLK